MQDSPSPVRLMTTASMISNACSPSTCVRRSAPHNVSQRDGRRRPHHHHRQHRRGPDAGPGGTLYAASKAALGGLTRGLARDLGHRGITVNLVQPGPTDTERNPADGPAAAANRTPLAISRHGKPEEVAELVAYLASEAAAFVTGATYNIDGGAGAPRNEKKAGNSPKRCRPLS